MALSLPEVEKIVQESAKIEPQDLNRAVETARYLQVPLEEVLVGRRLIRSDELGQLLAKAQNLSFIDLKSLEIAKEVLRLVPEEFAIKRQVVAFRLENGTVWLAMTDPADLEAIEFVKKHSGYQVQPVYTDKLSLQMALRAYKGSLKEEFAELVEKTARTTAAQVPLEELAKDVSVVKAVETLLEFALVEKASDIHIEPLTNEVVIRYRIDGVLHDVLSLPLELHSALVARIKIIANLKLDETRLPQDGRMQFESDEGEKVSLRVSVLPTVEGEKVVLRVLEQALQHFSLLGLGLDKGQEQQVSKTINKPYGLVLVTGPTGSGKTTTLYTILALLNTPGVNISTVEDPVENRLRRVNQTQVNPPAGYVFATGLRSLLRQDPDIIMVGEIRDKETAKIAVNSAMTGHMVLSTLHTNDASGAIPRLLDLEVEPFLLASTLELVIAQRLVRTICLDCKMTGEAEKDWGAVIGDKIKAMLPAKYLKGAGCSKCRYSGFRGRIGIFEVLKVSDEIRALIMERASVVKLKNQALEQGMETMLADGIKKVAQGLTTPEEVLRVCLE